MLYAEWPSGESAPVVELTSRFATRDRNFDLSKPDPSAVKESPAALKKYLEGTKLIPIDGIVLETSQEITRGATADVEKARAIYEWIVDNTFRDPKVRGCGLGDIKTMLETRYFGGKCADLNALFVGLTRAAGIPARDVYGVRAADSKEFKSLGKSGDISKAQHCRAEFYASSHGWVPGDPADVRKVVLEEPPGNLTLTDQHGRRQRSGDARDVGGTAAEELARSIGDDHEWQRRPEAEGAQHRGCAEQARSLGGQADRGGERRPGAWAPYGTEQRAQHELTFEAAGCRTTRQRRGSARDGRGETGEAGLQPGTEQDPSHEDQQAGGAQSDEIAIERQADQREDQPQHGRRDREAGGQGEGTVAVTLERCRDGDRQQRQDAGRERGQDAGGEPEGAGAHAHRIRARSGTGCGSARGR